VKEAVFWGQSFFSPPGSDSLWSGLKF